MKILAFDTTTETSSIAIADESGTLAEYNFLHRMTLSQKLIPDIQSMLKDCGMEMKDLDGIGVSLGPGSFTGLRIGVVTAKTLAQVLNVPVAGVVALDVLAHQFDYLPYMLVCPMIRVRKGEAYHAFYRTHLGGLERISEYSAGPMDQLVSAAREIEGGDILFCGDALKENLPSLQEGLTDRVVPTPRRLWNPNASIIARLAIQKIDAGEASEPYSVVPFYMRKSTPEIRLECKG